MVVKKLLQLIGIGKSSKRVIANHATFHDDPDPNSAGQCSTLLLNRYQLEGPSDSSSKTKVEDEISAKDKSLSQFDVVQDFSDHHYAKHVTGKVSKEWVRSIQQEWKILEKDLPGSIYVRVYEDRMDLLRAGIIGPAGTPYHDGLFFFDIRLPTDYPRSPPKVYYHSGGLRINPNLYESGKVCLSLLNTWWGTGCEKWSKSKSTLLQVLVSLEGLVLNEQPYFNEPGHKVFANTANGEKNALLYNQNTFLLSCKTMMYSLKKPPKHFEDIVTCHYHERGDVILQSCQAYMNGALIGSITKKGKHGSNTKYPASFLTSLERTRDLLLKEFNANKPGALKVLKEALPAPAEV